MKSKKKEKKNETFWIYYIELRIALVLYIINYYFLISLFIY